MSAATAFAISAPEFRAAGTDLSERRRSGLSCGTVIDLAASPETIGIAWGADGAARIGALTAIATIASDARLAEAYPGITAAAQGLATPQIRHMADNGIRAISGNFRLSGVGSFGPFSNLSRSTICRKPPLLVP